MGRIDTRTWLKRYEWEMQDVSAMNSEAAGQISKEIERDAHAGGGGTSRTEARTVNFVAHDAYLWGGYELNRYTEASLRAAIRHFQEAIDKDPRSARAYAGRQLPRVPMLRGTYGAPTGTR